MISLDLMRQYVQAADDLVQAKDDLADAERRVKQAQQAIDRLAPKMEGMAPPPVLVERQARVQPPKDVEGTLTDEQIRSRALAANKKIRGEATLAILKAMPATLNQITERTGLKKATVSTVVSRLQSDGVVMKAGEELLPGYENRRVTKYDLAV